jgi:type IX secretion system PorP/SprF family membrane protein
MKKIKHFLVYILFPVFGFAQQMPQANLFSGMQFGWNPAMTANWAYVEAYANYNQQWMGFDQAPRQVSAGIQYPFLDLNMGLGLQIMQDETGPLRQTGATLSYAYHLKLSAHQRLSFGLFGRFAQFRYDGQGEIVADTNDPLLGVGMDTEPQLNLGVGAFYRSADMDEWLKDHFFAGVSLYQAIPQNLIFAKVNDQANFAQVWHAYGLLGYRFDLEGSFIEPAVQIDYAAKNIIIPRFNLTYEMTDAFWAGLSIDGSFSASFQAGFILMTDNYWGLRIGVLASRNIAAGGLDQGMSYGFFAAYRFEL